MKLIVIIIFFIGQLLISRADTLYIKSGAALRNPNFAKNQMIVTVNDLNFPMNGYLVIKLIQNLKFSDTSIYYCEIFYIDKLESSDDYNQKILYNGSISLLLSSFSFTAIDDSVLKVFEIIRECYTSFYYYLSDDCKPFATLAKDDLTTDIFANNFLVEKNGQMYFVFKINLWAMVYEYYVYETLERCKTFAPISKLRYFSPATLEELEKYGFEKSSVVVKFID